jgi:hypothetical protein
VNRRSLFRALLLPFAPPREIEAPKSVTLCRFNRDGFLDDDGDVISEEEATAQYRAKMRRCVAFAG